MLKKLIDLSLKHKLHHALLFSGAKNSELKTYALDFAKFELCENLPDVNANANVKNHTSVNKLVSMFLAQTHPDFFMLGLEDGSNVIKVDQVRMLKEFVETKPQISQKKVAIIQVANKLNVQAANALLKTLEEPVSDTLIILLSPKKEQLIQTISSRCMEINFKSKSGDSLENEIFVKLAEDLNKLLHSANLIEVNQNWCKLFQANILVDVLYEIISCALWGDAKLKDFNFKNPNLAKILISLHEALPKKRAFMLLDNLIWYKKCLCDGRSLNVQLFFENFLLKFKNYCHTLSLHPKSASIINGVQ